MDLLEQFNYNVAKINDANEADDADDAHFDANGKYFLCFDLKLLNFNWFDSLDQQTLLRKEPISKKASQMRVNGNLFWKIDSVYRID